MKLILISIDNVVKGAAVTGLAFFLSFVPLKKIYSQGEPDRLFITPLEEKVRNFFPFLVYIFLNNILVISK